MIKAIIFDIGGVIVGLTDDDQYYPYLSKVSGLKVKRVKKLVECAARDQLDKCKISQKEFNDSLARSLGIKKNKLMWYSSYKEEGSVDKKVIEIIRRLSRRYTIAYLSNVDMSRYIYTLKLLKPFSHLFAYKFASCYLHMRKPDREIFNYVLSKMKIKANEAVFIDNLEENVAGARAVGIKGIVFKNSGDLKSRLRSISVRL